MTKHFTALLLPNLRTTIVLMWTFFVIICLGTPTRIPQAVDVPETDKWHHFVAFAALTYPLIVASRRYWILIIIIGFSFGALIKIIQPYVFRAGVFYDFTTNAFGVLIGFSLGLVVHNLKLKAAVLDDS